MRRLALLLTHLAVIAALAAGSGAHWIVLQGVAWTTMIIDYSHQAPLTEAVEKTFDGKHPCALCQTIASAEKQEQEKQVTQPVPDIKGVLTPLLQLATPTVASVGWPPFVQSAISLSEYPPVPPPRAV